MHCVHELAENKYVFSEHFFADGRISQTVR